jgi:selenocysteine lyase/cysteine desulfurase
VTHASNVTGVIQPAEDYGAIARRHKVLFMVDAAQTAGKYHIDVEASNIDLLAFSGHKGLFGPPGTGALYISDRTELDSIREGGTGSYSEQEEQPENLPDRFESGTLNSVGIAGLGAGLKFILSEGLDKIMNHEQSMTNRLIDGLAKITGVTVYAAKNKAQQAPVVSFNIKGYSPGDVGTILDQAFDTKVRTGLHCSPAMHKTLGTFPQGTVRISPSYLNIAEDIEMTLQAVERISISRDLKKPGMSMR